MHWTVDPANKVAEAKWWAMSESLVLYFTNIKDKSHPCTGTEALYRPYGP